MTDRTSLGHWVCRSLLEYAASERNLSPNTCELSRHARPASSLCGETRCGRRHVGSDRFVGRGGRRLPRSSGERAAMLHGHTEPAPRLDLRSGQVHRCAQSTACRMVRPDSDGADQKGCCCQRHLPGEAGDRCAACRSRSIVKTRSTRSRLAAVPLQLWCACERGGIAQDGDIDWHARSVRTMGKGRRSAVARSGLHHRAPPSPSDKGAMTSMCS